MSASSTKPEESGQSVLSWMMAKHHIVIIGQHLEQYRPWDSLYHDILRASTRLQRKAKKIVPTSIPQVSAPHGLIIVPSTEDGQIIKDKLMASPFLRLREGFEVDVPREQDCLVITTPIGFLHHLVYKRMVMSQIKCLLLHNVCYDMRDGLGKIISREISPKDNRCTIIYEKQMNPLVDSIMDHFLKSKECRERIWLPVLLPQHPLEVRALSVQQYLQENQRNLENWVGCDRVVVLCLSKEDGKALRRTTKDCNLKGLMTWPETYKEKTCQEIIRRLKNNTDTALALTPENLNVFDMDCVDVFLNFNVASDMWIWMKNGQGCVYDKSFE